MVSNLPATIHALLKKHPLIVESGLVAGAILLGKAFSLVWKITTAHQGTQVVGEIEFILTTINLIAALAIQGLPMAVTIWTAKLQQQKKTDHPLLAESLSFGFMTAVILTLIAYGVFHFFPSLTGNMQTSPTAYLWVIPGIALLEVLSAWFNGRKLYGWYAIGKYLGQPLLRLCLFFGMLWLSIRQQDSIHLHLTLTVVILLLALFGKVLQQLSLDAAWQQNQSEKWLSQRKKFWQQGVVLSGSLLLYVVYTASDIYWLNQFHSPSVVGVFSLLLALASLLELVFFPILNLLQTRLGIYSSQSSSSFQFLIKNIYISAIIGAITAVVLLAAKPLVVLLFGASGQEISTAQLGLILLWKLIANISVLPIRHYLDYFGQQKTTLLTMAVSFVTKIVLSSLLIPSYGIMGIIMANIGAELVHGLWLVHVLRTHYLRNC